jgi:hypothetical protein
LQEEELQVSSSLALPKQKSYGNNASRFQTAVAVQIQPNLDSNCYTTSTAVPPPKTHQQQTYTVPPTRQQLLRTLLPFMCKLAAAA